MKANQLLESDVLYKR